jgi:CRISPR type IV-associated protein Csf3
MTIFRVDVKFRTPCVLQDDVYFDTLVSAAYAKKILQADYYKGKQAGDIDLVRNTLGQYIDTEYGVFKCSKLFLKSDNEATTFYTKRFHFEDASKIKLKAKNIDTGRGYAKNYHKHMQYRVAYEGYFYVSGDLSKIQVLLTAYITHIGKKASQGYGEVASYVFRTVENFPWMLQGELVRNIPAKEFEKLPYTVEELSKIKRQCGYKAVVPPYWRSETVFCFY